MLSSEQMRTRGSLKWSVPPGVLGMAIAEADVELARPIREALHEAIADSRTGPFRDADAVIDALGKFTWSRWAWRLDPSRIIVGPSVNATILGLLRQDLSAGDIVVYSSPVYPVFSHLPGRIHAVPLDVPLLLKEGHWALNLSALEKVFARPAVRAYLLCHPQNPLGTVHSAADLSALGEIAMRNDVTVISDEVHAPLELDDAFIPFLMCGRSAQAAGVTVTGASKAWNLSGVNCAVAVWHNPEKDGIANKLAAHMRWETSRLGAVAAEAAFREGTEWLDAFRVLLSRHARMIHDATVESEGRIRWKGVQAGYLAWLDLSDLSDEPATILLHEAKVATTSGLRFGPSGVGHCRLTFACSTETLDAALRQILRCVKRHE